MKCGIKFGLKATTFMPTMSGDFRRNCLIFRPSLALELSTDHIVSLEFNANGVPGVGIAYALKLLDQPAFGHGPLQALAYLQNEPEYLRPIADYVTYLTLEQMTGLCCDDLGIDNQTYLRAAHEADFFLRPFIFSNSAILSFFRGSNSS